MYLVSIGTPALIAQRQNLEATLWDEKTKCKVLEFATTTNQLFFIKCLSRKTF